MILTNEEIFLGFGTPLVVYFSPVDCPPGVLAGQTSLLGFDGKHGNRGEWSMRVLSTMQINCQMIVGLGILLGAWSGVPQIAIAGNPWRAAVGEATAVQSRTEDILERVHEKYPRSFVAQPAAILDNSACRLVEMLKSGAECDQVRLGLDQTNRLWQHVAAMIESDCHMRTDRNLRTYMESLDRRIARLATAIQHAMKRNPEPVPILFGFDTPNVPHNGLQFPQPDFPYSRPPFPNAWGDRRSY